MRIVYRIVADCDPPPSDDYVQTHGDELDEALEDTVADFLLMAGAGFAITEVSATWE
jgi:hypothetical protein